MAKQVLSAKLAAQRVDSGLSCTLISKFISPLVMRSPYNNPVDPSLFVPIILVSLGLGLALTATYFVFQMKGAKAARETKSSASGRVFCELLYGLGASICLSVAIIFLCLQFGLWL